MHGLTLTRSRILLLYCCMHHNQGLPDTFPVRPEQPLCHRTRRPSCTAFLVRRWSHRKHSIWWVLASPFKRGSLCLRRMCIWLYCCTSSFYGSTRRRRNRADLSSVREASEVGPTSSRTATFLSFRRFTSLPRPRFPPLLCPWKPSFDNEGSDCRCVLRVTLRTPVVREIRRDRPKGVRGGGEIRARQDRICC